MAVSLLDRAPLHHTDSPIYRQCGFQVIENGLYAWDVVCPPLEAQMRNVLEAVAEGPELTLHLCSVTSQSPRRTELRLRR